MAADNSSCTAYSKTGGLSTSFRNWNMVCHNYHPCWCTMYLQIPDVVKTDGIQNYLAPSRQPFPHAVLQRYYCRLPDLPLHYSSTIVRCALQMEYRSKHWVLPHNSGSRYNLQPPASVGSHSLFCITDFHCNCTDRFHHLWRRCYIYIFHQSFRPTVFPYWSAHRPAVIP